MRCCMSENKCLLIFVISVVIRAPTRNCHSEYEFRSLNIHRIISYRQFWRRILVGICKRMIVISQNQHRDCSDLKWNRSVVIVTDHSPCFGRVFFTVHFWCNSNQFSRIVLVFLYIYSTRFQNVPENRHHPCRIR
jgi:hypothetical protein